MRGVTIWSLLLLLGCSGGAKSERKDEEQDQAEEVQVLAHRELTESERLEVAALENRTISLDQYAELYGGVEEQPRFGGFVDEYAGEPGGDFDVEIAQAAGIGEGAALNRRSGDAGPSAPKPKSETAGTWRRAQATPNASRLSVGEDEDLPLKALRAQVQVDGFRARVTLDLVFENPHDQQLEGTFRLRLPNEATPVSLGFGAAAAAPLAVHTAASRPDGWNEARMVPKERAGFAYGEVTRRRVDPALMEWAGAGVFAAHVFPLMPHALHQVSVAYDVDLMPVGGGLEYRLDLPEGVPDVGIDLAVSGPHTVTPAATAEAGHYRWRNPEARTFTVRVADQGAILLQGKDAAAGDFFAATLAPELPAAAGNPAPKALFLVDTSLTSNPERFNVYLKLLEEILTRNRATLQEFAVLFFDVDAYPWRAGFTPNTPDDVAALLKDARGLALEGATDLGRAFDAAARAATEPCDLFLLSDGAATWGESDGFAIARPLAKSAVRAVWAYNTGFQGTHTAMLEQLARESGGAVFTVAGEAEVAAAATAHTARPWRLDAIEWKGAGDVLVAGGATSLYPGQRLQVAGRGRPAGDCVLQLSQGDVRKSVRVPVARRVESPLAPAAYGKVAVGLLEELGDAAGDVAQAYALHFRVVGRSCSLLMLETDEDYARYGIRPEADVETIQAHPAGAEAARVRREAGDALGDPKAEFTAMVDRLGRLEFLSFALPDDARAYLDGLPSAAFAVRPDPLACQARHWSDVPGALQEQLASRKLVYDDVVAEAQRRKAKYGAGDALRTLSSLVENRPGDSAVARDVAFQAMEWGLGGQACGLLKRVVAQRPFEPHTYVALGNCLADLGHVDAAVLCFEIARGAQWDGRYGAFRKICALDYLHLLRRIEAGELQASDAAFVRDRIPAVEADLGVQDADLVVTITWNTDRTDVDLHVIDPIGEECYYEHRETKLGGRLTEDVTQGYGPEMFVLVKAAPGPYRIRAHYFSQDNLRTSLRTKVYATVYEHWGRADERCTRKAFALNEGKEFVDIATISWKTE